MKKREGGRLCPKDKSIGQLVEEEELAIFKRAGIKATAITSVLYDGSSEVLYETSNHEEAK